jgi:hypothetical protein
MLHVGTRSEPSVKSLVIIVVILLVALVYAFVSFGTGDWLWFSQKFEETPSAIYVYCYGDTISIQPGDFNFQALENIANASLSGRKRWDPLSLSDATYEEYKTSPNMRVIEFDYPEPIRVHSNYKFFSNVDRLIIPIEGRHADTNAVFGQNNGVAVGGSLHITSTTSFDQYLTNQDICPESTNSN